MGVATAAKKESILARDVSTGFFCTLQQLLAAPRAKLCGVLRTVEWVCSRSNSAAKASSSEFDGAESKICGGIFDTHASK